MLLGWRCLAQCETGAAVSSHASRLLQAARRVVRPMAAASVIDRPEAVVGNEYRYSGEPVVRRWRAALLLGDRSSAGLAGCRYSSPRRQRGRPPAAVREPNQQAGRNRPPGNRLLTEANRETAAPRRPGGRWFCFCGDPGTRASPPGGRAHESPTRGRMSRAVRGLFPGRPERLVSTLLLARCDHNWGLAAAMVGEELSMMSRVY